MSFITRIRRQQAIYWARTGVDSFGKTIFADPVQISCRWSDSVAQLTNAKGESFTSHASVYVGIDLQVGDRLKLGELESDTAQDPLTYIDAYEVQRFDKTPDLKVREFLRAAYL